MSVFRKTTLPASKALECPSCRHPVTTIRYVYCRDEQESFFYRCPVCTFIFARPVLIPELSDRHMNGIENAEMFNSPLLKRLYIGLFIKREIGKLGKLLKRKSPSFLDVGCGTGWTTHRYKLAGFETVGLEPSQVRAEYARDKYGLKIVSEYAENADFNKQFDAIMLRHIVEHFEDPAAMVQKVGGFLKDEGLLFIIVPNINCLGRYLFGTKWSWVLPVHCNFFTPKSIRAFLDKSGFEVLDCYQTPSPIYYPKSFARVVPVKFIREIFTKNKALSMMLFAPLAILGSLLGLGDNLNVIARKKLEP